jgi:hypothetical protein
MEIRGDGETFEIINNDDSHPVVGRFTGLAEGARVVAGGKVFSISYDGGDGNDVVLTEHGNAIAVVIVEQDGGERLAHVHLRLAAGETALATGEVRCVRERRCWCKVNVSDGRRFYELAIFHLVLDAR